MSEGRDYVRAALAALYAGAGEHGLDDDVTGRAVLGEVLRRWLDRRSWQDVAGELRFTADNLDPDAEHEFMRP